MYLPSKPIENPGHRNHPLRVALMASGVMAFSGLGDAFLYLILPIYGKDMGFSVFAIGLLLSVNRFVRILANTHIANLVAKLGMKNMLITCSILAMLTTAVYGLKVGVILFFIARVMWGLCYSGLKIATLNYASHVGKRSGLAFGLVQSIKSIGALGVLWLGPMVAKAYGIESGLFLIAGAGILGIVLAFLLPKENGSQPPIKVYPKTTFSPNTMNLLVFMLSASIDGILVVTLAQLFVGSYPDIIELLAIVAAYLLLKKLFSAGISLFSGFLTLRLDPFKLYAFSVLMCIAGLILVGVNLITIGVVVAFLFNTVVVTFSPLIAIGKQAHKTNPLQAISGVSTWWDLGAAIGTFVGIYLIEYVGPSILFLILSGMIFVLFINFVRENGNSDSNTI